MVINENNSQINAFVKGMNSDTAYDQIDNLQYVYAKNVRITKNNNIGESMSDNNFSSVHEGVVTPVPSGIAQIEFDGNNRIVGKYLGSDTINNIAVIITYDSESHNLYVYRSVIDNNATTNKFTDGFEQWWFCNIPEKEKQKELAAIKSISTVTYQELEDVIKLYIATGVYPVVELRIDGKNTPYSSNGENIDDFINNRILPEYPVYIDGVIHGALKTSQIQYTYRYYNKFGITTQLAPLTNKIQVIDPNRAKETGNAQDTKTSIGFRLKINNVPTGYKRLLIYRLSYIKPGEDANVELIYDGDIKLNTGSTTFSFNDVGTIPLLELTMQEFAAMSGMVVIPKVIELNQQYLFAANIKDDTIIQNLNVTGGNIEAFPTEVMISDSVTGIPTHSSSTFDDSIITNYLQDRNVNPDEAKNTYNNIFTSSLLRSLRRGENYTYGIVYYDKYGRHSDVQEISGVSVPEINSNEGLFKIKNGKLVANVYGVKITLPLPDVDDIVGCQIVRRSSKQIYQKTLLLVALARPIRLKVYTTDLADENWDNIFNRSDYTFDTEPTNSPYYPTGFLWSDNSRVYPGYMRFEDNDLWYKLIKPDVWYDVSGLTNWQPKGTDYFTASSKDNNELFQIFSSEIDFRRDDVLSNLQSQTLKINPAFYVGPSTGTGNSILRYNSLLTTPIPAVAGALPNILDLPVFIRRDVTSVENEPFINVFRWKIFLKPDTKVSENYIIPLYNAAYYNNTNISEDKKSIKSIKDVKLPQWYDGFSNIQLAGLELSQGGIKKYKEFTTSIDNYVFDNWVSFGLYDIKIAKDDNLQNNTADRGSLYLSGSQAKNKDELLDSQTLNGVTIDNLSYGSTRGWIGPGSSCFLVTTNSAFGTSILSGTSSTRNVGDTVICNIQHSIAEGLNEPDEFVQYFGFGNFFRLLGNATDGYDVVHYDGTTRDRTIYVFDGDIYITPHELTTMFKTYDFISADTLLSTLITNYVPMESKVNTFFDYGMNLLNTNSANLLIEPGSIEGVTTQDRPLHQYNQIYSANDESNDVFTLVVEEPNDNRFKQRTYYSEPKTNGEYIDNFVIFKPAAYIDVDPKYGEITNLLTDKNTLYYWQDTAFGKFSVNERSLINDQNGNTIMLGQAGILSRNDYISTKYGMRLYDFCATAAENGVYWVDVNNKAIVAGSTNECINLGERLNVQNIINAQILDYIPRVDYDLQNNELLCKCLSNDKQIVFNLKFNAATSVYTRSYDDILNVQNQIYGIYIKQITNGAAQGRIIPDEDPFEIPGGVLEEDGTGEYIDDVEFEGIINGDGSEEPGDNTVSSVGEETGSDNEETPVSGSEIRLVKHNHLNSTNGYLRPMALSFVVNHASSTTKVFDSLLIVPINRINWNYSEEYSTTYIEESQGVFSFETDINRTDNTIKPYTDREGNIIYNIPRFGTGDWGNRLRGKWMRVNMNYQTPTQYTTISHVITKFRQSYS